MEDGQYVDGSIWFYSPNKGAPIFFCVAFLASGTCHLWQSIYTLCAGLFVAGFVVRELGAFDNRDLIKYIVSICLVYAAPPLYELGNYYILGRILHYIPYHSPIHPGRVLTTFAAVSMVIEALNGNGAANAANQSLPEYRRNIGIALLKAALLMQIIVVCLFVALAAWFHVKCRLNGIRSSKVDNALFTLYISSSIIAVRTIYRIVEYFDLSESNFRDPSFDPMRLSPVIRYEWFFYVFEASLMLANSALLNLRHPRRWLPPSAKIYLALDGVTEIKGPGYKQDRNFFATLVDPFDIYGLITGRDRHAQYWADDGHGARRVHAKGNAVEMAKAPLPAREQQVTLV